MATTAATLPAPKGRSVALGELVVPLALVSVVLIMVIPLPAVLLDLLLAVSISIALIILMVGMYTQQPLEFSTFPSVLLVVTLFRLALNVASTRMILLYGHEGPAAAGHVIQAFGNFVVGGSYAVGIVVFLILVIINFAVITKGAGRIAEVAARFTLDAMPGKQLAIDADLNSGLITEKDARARRRTIEAEADFYGAMDGASKFVRGDAIAGLVITAINIVGGFVIGVGQHGVDWQTAAQSYTVLTIGDGLVSQLPALLISTAAGIIVTRAASGSDLGTEVAGQLLTSPRVLWLVTGILGFLSLVPGLPFLPFVALAGTTGALAAAGGVAPSAPAEPEGARGGAATSAEDRPEALLALDLMELEVGFELVPLVDAVTGHVPDGGGDLIERIRTTRRQLALEMGFIVPPIHIRDNLQLKPSAYSILVKGIEVARGELRMGSLLAINPGTVETPVTGVATREPAFGLDALWVASQDRERAQLAGYTVVDPGTVVITHLTEVIRRHAWELLGRQEVQGLLDQVAKTRPKVVEELVPQLLPVGGVQKVLQNLLREGVSIRDLATILEAVADHAGRTKDPDALTEYARQALGRSITQKLVGPDGTLALVTLAAPLERGLVDSIQRTEDGASLVVDPSTAQRLVGRLGAWMERFATDGLTPILLCGATLRPSVRRFLERYLPTLVVMAPAEIAHTVRVRSLGVVALDDA
ncbi:MAG TPA: flagellar biosynthesis protein FlhA [Candidatus Eisenbacteria bacterium]|nr:flagellar biosynthesis protein FlhA [Candidatus Eisenbacteria bacterium]